MREKIRLEQMILVEGKYDAVKLADLVDAFILPVNGFSVFTSDETKALIRRLGAQKGIIILTDSDAAGFRIRAYLNKLAQGLSVQKDVYKRQEHGCGKPDCHVGCDCDRFMEVWNLVFSQFDSDGKGHYERLARPNIDTGMGLERLACVMQGVDNMFEVDTVRNILNHVEKITGKTYGKDHLTDVSIRVITDHIRSTVFMVSDGNGHYERLAKPNIDTGMGLERLACVMQGVGNLFEVDTVHNILNLSLIHIWTSGKRSDRPLKWVRLIFLLSPACRLPIRWTAVRGGWKRG